MNDSQNTQVDILDLLAALRAGIKLIIIGTLVVCTISGIVSLFLEEEYEGLVQLLPPKEQKKGFGFADLLADLPIPSLRLGEKGTPADIFVAILKSPTIRRQMVNHFDLKTRYETENSMAKAIAALEKKTEIGKSEQGTILISVLDPDAQIAAEMANQYVNFLDSTNQTLAKTTASDRLDFISMLEGREGNKLEKVMQRLQKFQEDHNAISLDDQARASIHAASEMQIAAMELMIKKLSLLRSGFSRNHPEVQRLEQESLMRQEALAFLRDGANETANGTLDPHNPKLFLKENLFLPLRKIPEVAQEYAIIEKDVLVQSALMKLLLEQKAEAFIEGSNTTSTVQVLDQALPAEKPARPRRLLIVFIAGVLSLFTSIFYTLSAVYVRHLHDRWKLEYNTISK